MIRVNYYNLENKLICWRECKSREEAQIFVGSNNTVNKFIIAKIIEGDSTV